MYLLFESDIFYIFLMILVVVFIYWRASQQVSSLIYRIRENTLVFLQRRTHEWKQKSHGLDLS